MKNELWFLFNNIVGGGLNHES